MASGPVNIREQRINICYLCVSMYRCVTMFRRVWTVIAVLLCVQLVYWYHILAYDTKEPISGGDFITPISKRSVDNVTVRYSRRSNDTGIIRATTLPPPEEPICSSIERRSHIAEVCTVNDWRSEVLGEGCLQGFVVDKHKVLYCSINKVATVSLRSFFGKLVLNDPTFISKADFINATGIRRITDLEESECAAVLAEYRTLLVVRHPLDRLRSAYENKLSKAGVWNQVCLNKKNVEIINSFFAKEKGIPDRNFNPLTEILTFTEFLEIVAATYSDGFYDPHWATMFEIANPCRINFDFVLRLETLDSDLSPFFDYMHTVEHDYVAPLEITHRNMVLKKALNTEDEFFSRLSEAYRDISGELIERVLKVYHKDMVLFGYTWEASTASCSLQLLNRQTPCC